MTLSILLYRSKLIFPPLIFWAVVIAWISYRDKKSSGSKSSTAADNNRH